MSTFHSNLNADNNAIGIIEATGASDSVGRPKGTLHVTVDGGDSSSPSSTSNTPAILTSAGTALAANASRKSWSIQNLGTNPLFVRLGGTASTTVFHFILKAGTGADDGLGGLLVDNSWLGLVSVAGTSPRFVVSELT